MLCGVKRALVMYRARVVCFIQHVTRMAVWTYEYNAWQKRTRWRRTCVKWKHNLWVSVLLHYLLDIDTMCTKASHRLNIAAYLIDDIVGTAILSISYEVISPDTQNRYCKGSKSAWSLFMWNYIFKFNLRNTAFKPTHTWYWNVLGF